MARFGRITVVVALSALSNLFLNRLAAFVSPSTPLSAPSQRLRSRVSLAATQADVDAAKKAFQLQKWAADKLATEGSPMAAAATMRAQQAEAAYNALQAEMDGQPAPAAPAAAAPAVSAPVAAAPAAAAPVAAASSAVSDAELAEAKKKAQLLTWAANKLASEGSPMAATAATRAQQAEAAYAALQAQADGQPAPAAAAPAVAAAPAAAAPVAVPSSVSDAELADAKKKAQLLMWAANKLASEGSPLATAATTRAQQAEAEYVAMQAAADGQPAPAVAAPVASAPVAVAPAAAPAAPVTSAPSDEEVAKAKAAADLHQWAADQLASKGAPEAAAMQAKAAQSRQTYEALKTAQEQLVAR